MVGNRAFAVSAIGFPAMFLIFALATGVYREIPVWFFGAFALIGLVSIGVESSRPKSQGVTRTIAIVGGVVTLVAYGLLAAIAYLA